MSNHGDHGAWHTACDTFADCHAPLEPSVGAHTIVGNAYRLLNDLLTSAPAEVPLSTHLLMAHQMLHVG